MTDRTCSIPDCGKAHFGRGWCRMHYSRWYRHGDPLALPPRKLPPQNFPRYFGCTVEGCEAKHFGMGFCRSHWAQDYYQRTIDHNKALQAEYRRKHRDEARDRSRAWREANPERAREGRRRWYAEHADQVREYRRQYREANRDLIRAQNSGRKARLRGIEVNDLTAQQWTDIKAAFKQRCAYCQIKPAVLTMDHVVPLIAGGWHTASNIVPACQSCNSRKNDGPAPEHQPLLF